MLLRNISSSCRLRVPSLDISGRSASSSNILQKYPSIVYHQSKRSLSEKTRDPKDFSRYSGRPDGPKKNGKMGRPDGACEQRSAVDKKPQIQKKKASDLKNPQMWTGRPENCGPSSKGTQEPHKVTDCDINDKECTGKNKVSFVSARIPNIRTPKINGTIVNVEMSKASDLSAPDAPSNTIGVVRTSLESEGIKVDAKQREKVIAVQGVVPAQLGGILGRSKNDVIESKTSSGVVGSMNVGPAVVTSSSLEPSKTTSKFGGPSISVDIIPQHHVDVMTQRSSLRPVSQEERPTKIPLAVEQAEPLPESLDRRSEPRQSVGSRTGLDVKITGTPKLKVVKETFNEKRRHRVYSFGLSETGALGLYKPNEGRRWRKFISRPLRHQFAEETPVISAESGYGFTLFYVKSESNVKLYGCGINTDFQLGPTDAEVLTYPSPIDIHISSPNTKIMSFSAGRAHSAVVTDAEGVFLFGSNSYGQCGRAVDEDDKSACTITQIKTFGGEKAVGVNCGQDHSCVITDSGKVFACGWGSEGQTGLGHTSHSSEPSLVQGDINEEKIVKVAGKCDTVLALNEKGELFGWGSNEFRQIVDDKDAAQIDKPLRMEHVNKICGKIVDIAAGSSFCMVLNHEGDVYVWGYGILGGGPELERTAVPTLLPRTLFGTNEYQPKVIPLRIYCGLDHMAVMNSLNHVYSWGKNKHGCLGIGNARDQYFPYKLSISANAVHVSCAVDHSIIVTDHN